MPSRNSVGGTELRGLLAASEHRAQVFNISKEEKQNLKSQNCELEHQVKAANRVTRVVTTKKANTKSRRDPKKSDEIAEAVLGQPKVTKLKKKPKRRPIIDQKAAKRRREKRIQEALLKQQAEDEASPAAPTKVLNTEALQELTPTKSSSYIDLQSQDSTSEDLPHDDTVGDVAHAEHTQAGSSLADDSDDVVPHGAKSHLDSHSNADGTSADPSLKDDEGMSKLPSSPSIDAVEVDGETADDSNDKFVAKSVELLLHDQDQGELENESEDDVEDVFTGDLYDASDELLEHELVSKTPVALTGAMAVHSGLVFMSDTSDVEDPASTEDESGEITHTFTTSSDAGTSDLPTEVQMSSTPRRTNHLNTSSSPQMANMSSSQLSSKARTTTTNAEKTLSVPLLTPDKVTQYKIRPALAALEHALTKVDYDVYLAAFNAWKRKGIDEQLFQEAVGKVVLTEETKEMHKNVMEGVEWLELAVLAEEVEKALHVKA